MKKMLFILPICTAALIGVFVVSAYAATVNDKPDSYLIADSNSKVTDVNDQAVKRGE